VKPTFYIQPGHVTVQRVKLKETTTFRAVFPAIFRENDESAFIFWKEIPIRFHYTFECFANLDRLVSLINRMLDSEQGNEQFTFVTDALVGNWSLSWKNDELTIQAHWMGNKDYAEYAEALNEAGDIIVPIKTFCAEWKLMLVQVLNALDAVGAAKLNDGIMQKVAEIGKILQSTDAIGILYSKK
jgi:hypothetical protein